MICFVVPPTVQQFIDDSAQISFNDSAAGTIKNINAYTLTGVDTSRYIQLLYTDIILCSNNI